MTRDQKMKTVYRNSFLNMYLSLLALTQNECYLQRLYTTMFMHELQVHKYLFIFVYFSKYDLLSFFLIISCFFFIFYYIH